MGYVEIINTIFLIINSVIILTFSLFVVFGIVGVFVKKRFKPSDKLNRYGIIIPARNEEKVIKNLLDSIRHSDYPQDKLDIWVIAHNCTDRTAEVARNYGGIHVVEYNNPDGCTKGYGLNYLFKEIEKQIGITSLDGYFIFDSDNIVASNYFSKMNDAFNHYKGNAVITSFRNSKNFGKGLMPGLYGMYFTFSTLLEMRGRTALGCSTRVSGTGYVIPSKVLYNGWNYLTLTEDWELSADIVLSGRKIRYCEDAIFYDEQPTKFSVMWKQRLRWSRGHLLVFLTRFPLLFKHLFKKGVKNKLSVYDLMMNCSPICLTTTTITIINSICLIIAPFVTDSSFYEIFITDYHNILFSTGILFTWLRNIIFGYLGTFALGLLTFIVYRKRIRHVNPILKILILIVWPLFLMIQWVIDIHALFSKNLSWDVIPHEDNTKIKTIEETNKEF